MSNDYSRLISCKDAVRQLWDYLDESTPPDQRAQVEEHLEHCLRCCGELEFIRHLKGMLDEPDAEELSADVVSRLERFVEGL